MFNAPYIMYFGFKGQSVIISSEFLTGGSDVFAHAHSTIEVLVVIRVTIIIAF